MVDERRSPSRFRCGSRLFGGKGTGRARRQRTTRVGEGPLCVAGPTGRSRTDPRRRRAHATGCRGHLPGGGCSGGGGQGSRRSHAPYCDRSAAPVRCKPPPSTPLTGGLGRVAGAPHRRSIRTGPRRATASRRAPSATPTARHRRSPEQRWGLNGVAADALGLAFGPPPRLPSVARDPSDSSRLRWLWAGGRHASRPTNHSQRPPLASTRAGGPPAPALPLTRPAGGGSDC